MRHIPRIFVFSTILVFFFLVVNLKFNQVIAKASPTKCEKAGFDLKAIFRKAIFEQFIEDNILSCLPSENTLEVFSCLNVATNLDESLQNKHYGGARKDLTEWENNLSKNSAAIPSFFDWPPEELNSIENSCHEASHQAMGANLKAKCDQLEGWTILPIESRISFPGRSNRIMLFYRQKDGVDQWYNRPISPDGKSWANPVVDSILMLPPTEKNSQYRAIFLASDFNAGEFHGQLNMASRQTCFRCHPNGPRGLNPVPGSPALKTDQDQFAAVSKVLSGYGRIDTSFNGLVADKSGPHFGQGSCTGCHNNDPYSMRSRGGLGIAQVQPFSMKNTMTSFWMPTFRISEAEKYNQALEKIKSLSAEDRQIISSYFQLTNRAPGESLSDEELKSAVRNTLNFLRKKGHLTSAERDQALDSFSRTHDRMVGLYTTLIGKYARELEEYYFTELEKIQRCSQWIEDLNPSANSESVQ